MNLNPMSKGEYSLANMSEHGSTETTTSGGRTNSATSNIPSGHVASPPPGAPVVPAYAVSNLPQEGTEAWRTNWYDLHIFCSPWRPSDFCCTTCLFPWFTMSHIAYETNAFKRFMNIRGVLIVVLVVLSILYEMRMALEKSNRIILSPEDEDGDGKIDYETGFTQPAGAFPYWLFFILTLIAWKLRVTVRKQRGIAGSDAHDCFLATCCQMCITFQMAYQIWKDPVEQPGGVLSELHRVDSYDPEVHRDANGSSQRDNLNTNLLSAAHRV